MGWENGITVVIRSSSNFVNNTKYSYKHFVQNDTMELYTRVVTSVKTYPGAYTNSHHSPVLGQITHKTETQEKANRNTRSDITWLQELKTK